MFTIIHCHRTMASIHCHRTMASICCYGLKASIHCHRTITSICCYGLKASIHCHRVNTIIFCYRIIVTIYHMDTIPVYLIKNKLNASIDKAMPIKFITNIDMRRCNLVNTSVYFPITFNLTISTSSWIIIVKCIKWVFAKVETILTATYFTFLLIFLPNFILETTALQIFIKTFETFYFFHNNILFHSTSNSALMVLSTASERLYNSSALSSLMLHPFISSVST